jgi:hypothetical protein
MQGLASCGTFMYYSDEYLLEAMNHIHHYKALQPRRPQSTSPWKYEISERSHSVGNAVLYTTESQLVM